MLVLMFMGCANDLTSEPRGPLANDSDWTDTGEDTGTVHSASDVAVEYGNCEGSGDYDLVFDLYINDGDQVQVAGHYSDGYQWWSENNGVTNLPDWEDVSTWDIEGGRVHELCNWLEDDGAAFYQIDQFVVTVIRAQ